MCIQIPGKYTVVTDYEKGVSEEFAVKSGDLVQLIREGEDGLWYADLFGTFIHNCVWKADAEGKAFKGSKWSSLTCFCSYRYVKNLTTGREGWIPANNLLMLIGNSKSAQSLSSSGRLLAINGGLTEDSCYGRKLWKNDNHISFDFSLLSQNQALLPALWARRQVAVIAAMPAAPASQTLRANIIFSPHLHGK